MDLCSTRHSGCVHRRCYSLFGGLTLAVMVLLQGHLASAAISSVDFEKMVASCEKLSSAQLDLLLRMSPSQLKNFARRLTPKQQRTLAKRLSAAQVTLFERAGVRGALVAAGSKQKNKMYIDMKTMGITWCNNAEEANFRKQLEDRVAAGESVFYDKSACIRGKMEFVRIPRGTFMMGSRMGERARMIDEQLHEVKLTHDYWMSCFEVTQAQWRAIMGEEKRSSSDASAQAYSIGLPTGDAYPKYNVNQEEALQFCRQLTLKILQSRANAKNAIPENMEFTLPTEAQWEYACRAGTETPFYSGDVLLARDANYRIMIFEMDAAKRRELVRLIKKGGLAGMMPAEVSMILRSTGLTPEEIDKIIKDSRQTAKRQQGHGEENRDEDLFRSEAEKQEAQQAKVSKTVIVSVIHQVGECHPNDFGLYDMHGNMWEWCRGMYYQYPKEGVSAVDPQGNTSGAIGVARGGSWYSFDDDCRSARRLDIFRNVRQNNIGFRVILAVKRH